MINFLLVIAGIVCAVAGLGILVAVGISTLHYLMERKRL